MQIGIVSDTHDNRTNVERIVALFNESGVERVVHTGDFTQPRTLQMFGALHAPLHGVFGNNDVEREALREAGAQLGFQLVEPPLELEWAGRRIVVVHDEDGLDADVWQGRDLLLHGHDHRHTQEWRGDTLVFNPGECAGQMKGWNSVGVVDLEHLEPRILKF